MSEESLSQYFIEAFEYIRRREVVPYYLEGKVRDLAFILSNRDKRIVLNDIMSNEHAGDIFRYLSKNGALTCIFAYLNNLRKVPQNKGRSKNAFDHTINVIDLIDPKDYHLRWAALFHDLGKYDSYMSNDGNFYKHQSYSSFIALRLVSLLQLEQRTKILSIVENHMSPLDYQRNPNWKDAAVKAFINRCGRDHVFDVIDFAYYDKKAENDVKEYLDIIVKFKDIVKEYM